MPHTAKEHSVLENLRIFNPERRAEHRHMLCARGQPDLGTTIKLGAILSSTRASCVTCCVTLGNFIHPVDLNFSHQYDAMTLSSFQL